MIEEKDGKSEQAEWVGWWLPGWARHREWRAGGQVWLPCCRQVPGPTGALVKFGGIEGVPRRGILLPPWVCTGLPSPSHRSDHQTSRRKSLLNKRGWQGVKKKVDAPRTELGVPCWGCQVAPELQICNGNVCISAAGAGPLFAVIR